MPVPPAVAASTDADAVAGAKSAPASPSPINDHASSTPSSPGAGAASAVTDAVSPTAITLGREVIAACSTRTTRVS